MTELPQSIKSIIESNVHKVFADDLISCYEENKTPVRYFIYDEDIHLEDCDSYGDYRECDEQEFLQAEGTIEYNRFTIFEHGSNHINLTKNPFI